MIIKKYDWPEGPDFKLDLHIVSKFLHADSTGLYFLVDPRSTPQEIEFYQRYPEGEGDATEVTAKMTFLKAYEIETLFGGHTEFLFWNRG